MQLCVADSIFHRFSISIAVGLGNCFLTQLLCPLLEIYSDMKHSYIVELKYAKYKDPESRVEELRQEAIAQANRYADTETVKNAIGNTKLHKIVVDRGIYQHSWLAYLVQKWGGKSGFGLSWQE